MIRFSKSLLMNPAQIWISGIRCNYDNIIKIANIFNSRWIVITIDSVIEESSLLRFIKDQGLKYFVKQHSNKYIEVSVIIQYDLFEDVLEKAISEDPENIFLFNLLDPTNWNVHLQHSFEKLVAAGIADMFISISLDENSLLISVNKSLLPPREIYNKIKALRFD